ncbi:MAG: phospholipase [Chloroflexi bacterium HGW-Chloroflexi-8]|nr:MAG: phospholipase [Chloroflexi bacterium HGW-Chloroflexi-8]
MSANIHKDQPLLKAGIPIEEAKRAMILLHGRGATAESILDLAELLPQEDMTYLAPQAAFSRWYPNSFLAPLEQNEPDLSFALERVDEIVQSLLAQNFKAENIWLAGFSQGASLTAEYVARNPRRFGGLMIFSGGLIGPLESSQQRLPVMEYDGMPVFIGCSDTDPHIPLARVRETAAFFKAGKAHVDLQIYPGMDHTIIQDELDRAMKLLSD